MSLSEDRYDELRAELWIKTVVAAMTPGSLGTTMGSNDALKWGDILMAGFEQRFAKLVTTKPRDGADDE